MKTVKKLEIKSILFSLVCVTASNGIGMTIGDYLAKSKEFRVEQKNEDKKERELSKSLEDIYFDIEDKEILSLSPLGKEKIEEICNNKLTEIDPRFDERYIDALTINKETAATAYIDFKELKIDSHRKSDYYNEKDESIDWENLADRIYENSQEYVLEYSGPDTKSFTKEEVEEKIKTLETFAAQVKTDFPDFDMEELVCKLEDYSFIEKKKIPTYPDRLPLVTASDDCFTYYVEKKEVENTNTDLYADFHVFVNSCIDKKEAEEISKVDGGIAISTNPYINKGFDWCASSRYHYAFLEEIYAELYSQEKSTQSQNNYMNYDEVLDAIQLVLGLNESYKIDSILEDLLYQDPISFINHFPVYGEDKDDYFVENARMLQSFNTLLKRNPDYFSSLIKEGLIQEEAFRNLDAAAVSQLSKIFFSNLMVMNEKHYMDMSLEDNYAMTQLFVVHLQNMQKAVIQSNRAYSIIITGQSTFLEDMNIFFDYLSEKYNIEQEKVQQGYLDYNLLDDYTLPSFLSEEKKEFYQSLIKNRNRDISEPYSRTLQKTMISNTNNLLTNGKK